MLLAVLLLQVPPVQTHIVREALKTLNDRIDGRISVGSAYILPFNTVIVKDALVMDDNPARCSTFTPQDTLIQASTLIVTFGKDILEGTPIQLHRVSAEGIRFNLVLEENGLPNVTRVFRATGDSTAEKSIPDLFRIKRLNARDLTYSHRNVHTDSTVRGHINFTDLEARLTSVKARDFNFTKEGVTAEVIHASISEKSGYNLHSLSGKVQVNIGRTLVTDAHIVDNWSDLQVDEFSMSYRDGRSFGDFTHNVRLHGRIRNSRVDGRSISTFTRRAKIPQAIDIETFAFDGPVADLKSDRLIFSNGSGIHGDLSCHLNEIDTPANARINAQFRQLTFSMPELERILSSLGIDANLKEYARNEHITLALNGNGPINRLSLHGSMHSHGLGDLECRLNVQGLLDGTPEISGSVTTRDLDIATAIGTGPVRECSMHAALRASIGKSGATMTVDTLQVSRLNMLDYDYSNIVAAGTFSGNAFDGRVICSDPNLNFLFQGIFNLSQKTSNALYKFYFNLGYADLHALNIDKRPVSRASGYINANYMRFADSNLIGDVDMGRIVLESQDGKHNIGDISLSSHSSEEGHKIIFDSDFAEGTFITDANPLQAVDILKDAALRDALPVFCNTERTPVRGNMDLDFRFTDTREILAFFRPGIYIADDSTVNLHIDNEGGMEADIQSQRIASMDKYAKNLDIRANNEGGRLNLFAGCSELNTGLFKMQKPRLSAEAAGDRIDANYIFDGYDDRDSGDYEEGGNINLFASLSDDGLGGIVIDGGTAPSTLSIDGNEWEISDSGIGVERGEVYIHGLELKCGRQSISAEGVLSGNKEDSLNVNISGLDISLLSPAIGIDLTGSLSGSASLLSPLGGIPKIVARLETDDAAIGGRAAGKLTISSDWRNDRLSASLINEIGGASTINATASLTSDRTLGAKVSLNGFDLGYFAGLQTRVYKDLQGSLSGEITADGPIDRLSIGSSDMDLDGMIQIDFTEVKYYLRGPLSIDNNGIILNNISINDGGSGRGVLSGGLRYDRLKDMRTDLTARFSGLRLIDIKAEHNDNFYGRAGGDGVMRLEGPFNNLKMTVDARTTGNGNIYIPLKSGPASSANLLTFREPEKWIDPYERMMEEMNARTSSPGNFDISLHVTPNPEVSCHLEIDDSGGNAIVAKGNGNIDIDINSRENTLNFNGDYNITEGNFHYSVIGITSRDFTIKSGSSIKFEGDIMNSNLDIDASYNTKTSLSSLIADTTSVGTRRNVICGIKVSDRIRNPQLKFTIDIPDLDPTTESLVKGALNTEDKMQRQFLSLLVANSFLPEDRSGISNNSDMLFSNVTEIMAGQLNNILQRLNIPLDLGLKYQPTDEGEDMFDVAVSTRLFDNRVTVNGNISNNQNSVNRESGDVAGDLDIGIKLDKAGAVQLSLFSHSADLYSNYLDNLQRNGVGIGYRKEFRTFREFWRDLFSSRKKRRERALRETLLSGQSEKVTITIESE